MVRELHITCGNSTKNMHSYKTIDPVKFRLGDIVEAQVSFTTIPLYNKQFKMLIILQAITLLDQTPQLVTNPLVY